MDFLANATGSESRAQTLFSDAETTAISGLTVTPASPTSWPVNLEIAGTVQDTTTPTNCPTSGPNVLFFADGSSIGGSGAALNSSFACSGFDSSASLFGQLAPGVHSIVVSWAGGSSVCGLADCSGSSYSFNYTVSPLATVISNLGGGATINYGGSTTLSAEVDVTGTAIPLCSGVTLTAGNATCVVTYAGASGEGAGTHLIQAFFNPATTNLASSSSAQISVLVNPGTVLLSAVTSSAGTTPIYGTATTYSVTLTSAAPTPAYTGVVQFLDNGALLGTVAVCTGAGVPYTACTAAGAAVYVYSSGVVPTAGPHNIVAQFMGDSNYSPSAATARLNVTVAKAPPTITAASDPVLANFGKSFTTPQVTVAHVGSGVTPTGTVSLSSGATAIGIATALDTAGHVTITAILPVAIGVNASPQALKYSYSGDSNYLATDTGTTDHITVSATAITYTVTSATVASFPAGQFPVLGQPIVLTATLAALPGEPTTPGDTIIFTEGATTVCGPVVVSNNVAACTVPNGANISPFGVGTHSITLGSFSGDANYTLATTGNTPLALTVAAAPTITTLSAVPASALPAQSVTFTATVTIPAPGVAILNGVVNFTQDTPTGTTAISGCTGRAITGGVATCPTSFSSPGAYAIHATYVPADGNTATSTGNLAYSVNKVQPGIVLVSSIPGPSPNPVFGEPITYTVTVSPPSGTTQQPSGQVTFYDGGVQLIGTTVQTLTGTTTMTASVTVSSSSSNLLTVGTHAITVLYGGDSNFGSITSAILYQTVVPATAAIGGDPSGVTVSVSYTGGGPVYGQPITFTARVTAAYNGKPSGTVTFTDAGTGIPGAVAPLVLCTPVARRPRPATIRTLRPIAGPRLLAPTWRPPLCWPRRRKGRRCRPLWPARPCR